MGAAAWGAAPKAMGGGPPGAAGMGPRAMGGGWYPTAAAGAAMDLRAERTTPPALGPAAPATAIAPKETPAWRTGGELLS
jgi:hypothetical protein